MCTLLTNKRYELLYNCGIQLLHIGRPLAAFECLIEAVQVYHANPRLWLRLAECCIAANKGVSLYLFEPPPRLAALLPLLTLREFVKMVFRSLSVGQNLVSWSHVFTFWLLVRVTTCVSSHVEKLKPFRRSYLQQQWSASCRDRGHAASWRESALCTSWLNEDCW